MLVMILQKYNMEIHHGMGMVCLHLIPSSSSIFSDGLAHATFKFCNITIRPSTQSPLRILLNLVSRSRQLALRRRFEHAIHGGLRLPRLSFRNDRIIVILQNPDLTDVCLRYFATDYLCI
jgi:hypothetical protein